MRITKEKYTIKMPNGAHVSFTADTPDALIRSVQKYRRNNNVQISDDDTAKEIAATNGYEHKDGIYSKNLPISFAKPRLNLAGVKSACGAMLQTLKSNIVGDAEIYRRWQICQNCPVKTSVSDCMSCGGAGRVADWINKLRGAAGKSFRIEQEAGMTFCGLCGCSHALMIPTKMEFQKAESEKQNQLRPDQCWLRVGGINYKP
jgi:hypothetical protein